MGEDPRTALTGLLGEPAGQALEPLGDDRLSELLRDLEQARREQRRALAEAAEESLGFVPRLLRGAAKKIVFG